MFSLSQSDNGYYCFEWVPTENGPKIIQYEYIKTKKINHIDTALEKVIESFNPQTKHESKSLSLTLNINNINISSYRVDMDYSLEDSLLWYNENIINKEYANKHDIYFYPIYHENFRLFLVVSVNKLLKQNIINCANKLNYNIVNLSIDIFSASTIANQFYKTNNDREFILWKISRNNNHYLVYFNKNLLNGYINLRINEKKINVISSIGSIHGIKLLNDFVKSIFIDKKEFNKIKNIYVYQTKEDMLFLKKIVKSFSNIQPLDISALFDNSNKNIYKFLPYVENGVSLKGIDV